MITCANCEVEAIYTVADPGANAVNYCGTCLPHWLQDRAKANHFPLVTPVVEKSSKKKKTDAEAPVDSEEDPQEEAAAEVVSSEVADEPGASEVDAEAALSEAEPFVDESN